jgi:hypothetical protein
MMHGREKSDSAIVAVKPTNKAVPTAAEPAEPRAGTKGNANQQSMDRAQNRTTVSQALERIRRVAQAVRHHSPKVGAVCGNPARTDLSGGRSAMAVPTALRSELFRADPLRTEWGFGNIRGSSLEQVDMRRREFLNRHRRFARHATNNVIASGKNAG